MADIDDIDAAQTVKIVGSDPDGTEQLPIGSVAGQLKTRTSFGPEILTAFGRLKTALPTVLYEYNFIENERSDLFDTNTAGSATITYDSTEKTRNLNLSTASGDRATVQTFQRVKYTPGQQNAVLFVNQFQPKANVVQSSSYGDESDCFFFRMSGLTFEVGIRSSVTGSIVENTITQANFNGDKLDGTGESGITADFSKPIIFFVQFQWLGSGRVSFWAAIENQTVLMHEEIHSGVISETKYMRTATLPFRFEAENTAATASNTTFKISCGSSISEGRTQVSATQRHVYNTTAVALPNGGALIPTLAIRLKSTSDVANIKPIKFGFIGASRDELAIELVVGGTLTGGTWTSVDSTSSVEANYTATSHTGGIVVDGALATQEATVNSSINIAILNIGKFIDGTSQVLVLRARTLNNNAAVLSSLTFQEIY